MRCSVSKCDNFKGTKANDVSFFAFPSDAGVQKKWVKFCRRKDKFNPKYSYICMRHFNEEDFENNLKFQMGFTKKRTLKRGVVPTLWCGSIKNSKLNEQRMANIRKRDNKKIVEELLREHNAQLRKEEAEALEEREEVFIKNVEFCNAEQEYNALNLSYEDFLSDSNYNHEIEQTKKDNSKVDYSINKNENSELLLKSIATQTKIDNAYACAFVTTSRNFLTFNISCFYCDACFSMRDWDKLMCHVASKHRYKMEAYHKTELEDETQIQIHCDVPKESMESEESCAADGHDFCFEYEDHFVKESLVLNSQQNNEADKIHEEEGDNIVEYDNIGEDDNIDELCDTQLVSDPSQKRHKIDAQLDIETSDATVISYLIDLLQSHPTLWFIDGPKTSYYKKGLKSLYAEFLAKYDLDITQKELHETLIEIRDWYQQIFQNKSFDKLLFPQSEYYNKLLEFFPDKLNGKTCEFCERFCEDHVQYFLHKKLEHTMGKPNDNGEEAEEISLVFLKKHVTDYFYALRLQSQTGEYECQLCLKKYARRNTLIEHIRTHLGIRDHVCHICGKTFIKKAVFAKHKRGHQSHRRYECLICEKVVKTKPALTHHRKRYHTATEGTIEEIERMRRRRLPEPKLSKYCVPLIDENDRRYTRNSCEKTCLNN